MLVCLHTQSRARMVDHAALTGKRRHCSRPGAWCGLPDDVFVWFCRSWAVYAQKRVPNLWRVTHHYDIVPHIPTTQQNFYHSPHEVYYPGDDVTYQICNPSGEDNNCSNSCSRTISCTSVSDHLLYMTVPIGSDQC